MVVSSFRVHVHVGTHCSGSENFHRFLAANSREIGARGYDLACPPKAALADGAYAAAEASGIGLSMAERGTGERRGLIVSDREIGSQLDQLMKAHFYPGASLRAAELRAAIGLPVDRLVLVVQPYDHLFLAAWQQFALGNVVGSFDDFVPALSGFSGGWVELVEDLRAGLEARHVTVLAAPQESPVILSHLVPGLTLDAPRRPVQVLPVTNTAVAMAQRHLRLGGRFAPGQRERLLAFHARQPQLPVPAAFEGLRLADLRGRYVADLDSLARIEGVEVVGGTMAHMAAE